MAQIKPITDRAMPAAVGAIYEHLLEDLRTEEFYETVRTSILALTGGVRRIYLFEQDVSGSGQLCYHRVEPAISDIVPMYMDRYLARDPLCDAFRAAPHRSDMALFRITASDVPIQSYRQQFFEEMAILERLSIFQRGAEAWRVLSLCRHESEGAFSDAEVSSLVSLAAVLLPMLPFASATPYGLRHLTLSQLEERFARRFPELTLRERQVCARAAIGVSVEGTSLDLGIAKTSVQTYRQRGYRRLNVTSSYELSSLVSN